MIELEPLKYTTEIKYFWGLCNETTSAVVIGVSIILSIKIVFSFILALKRNGKRQSKTSSP